MPTHIPSRQATEDESFRTIINEYRDFLSHQAIAPSSIESYLGRSRHFLIWLNRNGLGLSEVDGEVVGAFPGPRLHLFRPTLRTSEAQSRAHTGILTLSGHVVRAVPGAVRESLDAGGARGQSRACAGLPPRAAQAGLYTISDRQVPVAVAAIVLKPLLDQRGKLVELRSAHRRCASVARRHRKLKHLPHALA